MFFFISYFYVLFFFPPKLNTLICFNINTFLLFIVTGLLTIGTNIMGDFCLMSQMWPAAIHLQVCDMSIVYYYAIMFITYIRPKTTTHVHFFRLFCKDFNILKIDFGLTILWMLEKFIDFSLKNINDLTLIIDHFWNSKNL